MSKKHDSVVGWLLLIPVAIVIAIGIDWNLSWIGWVCLWLCAFAVLLFVVFVISQYGSRQREEAERTAQQCAQAFRRQIEEAEHAEEQLARTFAMTNIDQMTGVEFEQYLQRLLRTRGYAAELTKASSDFGVDLILTKNGERIAVQVKRYGTAISRRAISDAVAGMKHYSCSKAMVVTSNYFTVGAKTLATSNSCTLVDRDLLIKWVYEYCQKPDAAISSEADYHLSTLRAAASHSRAFEAASRSLLYVSTPILLSFPVVLMPHNEPSNDALR